MTDIRIVSQASVEGIWADWLFHGATGDTFSITSGKNAWIYFGKKYFGERFFANNYYSPPWHKMVRHIGQTKRGFLDESHELATAVLLALLTDARAADADFLPDPDSDDRRGWWGNLDAETLWDGWPIGCKNWLLARAKITSAGSSEGSTLSRAEDYTRSALQPLIDKRICSVITVAAERRGLDRIDVSVVIYRGPRDEIALRFQDVWSEIRGG